MVRSDGSRTDIRYDRLLIGTGARPVRPEISGLDLPGVFPLHTMADSFSVRKFLEDRHPERAVIIGAGYIGLEMADAFRHRNLHVTVASRTDSVLPTVDREFGECVEAELRRHDVEVFNRVEAVSIADKQGTLVVSGTHGFERLADLVLVAVGVQPNSELGAGAGIPTGIKGALQVSRRMETILEDVYAAGDCVETFHRVLNRPMYLPLGSTAHKQGQVAAENAVGGNREFAGSLGTQVVKIFDLVAARTGLRDREARQAGFDPFTTETKSWDHKAYYPGAQELTIRLSGDRGTSQLLGAQLLGHIRTEVSKRADVYASALFHGMSVENLNDLDLFTHRRFRVRGTRFKWPRRNGHEPLDQKRQHSLYRVSVFSFDWLGCQWELDRTVQGIGNNALAALDSKDDVADSGHSRTEGRTNHDAKVPIRRSIR